MKEEIKKLIKKKMLVIPLTLVLVIMLVAFGLGKGRGKDLAEPQDEYTSVNNEQHHENKNEPEKTSDIDIQGASVEEQLVENETVIEEEIESDNDLVADLVVNETDKDKKADKNSEQGRPSISSSPQINKEKASSGSTKTQTDKTNSSQKKETSSQKIGTENTPIITGKPKTNNTSSNTTVYRLSVNGYTRDGKRLTKTFESTNPNEVVTYYTIEGDRLYEIKQNMREEVLSKKEVKAEYTYKETVVEEVVYKHSTLIEKDATMPIGQEVVYQEGVNGIGHIIMVEKFLFDKPIDVNLKEVTVREKQDMIIKEGSKNPLGNSGKVFNSLTEAKTWAEQERNNKNSKWYKYNYVVYPTDHTETKFTVDFL